MSYCQGSRHIYSKVGGSSGEHYYLLEMEENSMDKGKLRKTYQEVISIEEYLRKRQKMKESEQKEKAMRAHEKSPAWLLAELYV